MVNADRIMIALLRNMLPRCRRLIVNANARIGIADQNNTVNTAVSSWSHHTRNLDAANTTPEPLQKSAASRVNGTYELLVSARGYPLPLFAKCFCNATLTAAA